MFKRQQFLIFLFIYAALRIFSFWFGPDTPLQNAHFLNQTIALFFTATTLFLVAKNHRLGWLLVAGEIILGGSGNYFALLGISIRTLICVGALLIYTARLTYNRLEREQFFYTSKQFRYPILILCGWALCSALLGLSNGHSVRMVFADFIPYLFLLYIFPFTKLWLSENFRKILFNLVLSAIIGNFIFIIFSFIGFSGGLFQIQDAYYHWFRDVANGKITALNFNFYRIVLNEHLLIAPLILLFIGRQISKPNNINIVCALMLITILSVNITRIYLLALFAGLVILGFMFKQWRAFIYGGATLAIFVIIFTGFHLAASRGQSLGWELLGVKLGSIAAPQIEDSSLSRLLLLPKILEQIKTAPIFGRGLGDTVTVYSPIFKNQITTTQFDWGFLEIIDEMGVIGLIIWGLFITSVIYSIWQNKSGSSRYLFLTGLLALLIQTITSPVLFHTFGALFLITCLLPIGYHYSISAGGIILNKSNQLAMVASHTNDFWMFPKGNIDAGEDEYTAAKREIYEETGIKSEQLVFQKRLGEYERITWIPRNKFLLKKIVLFLFKTEAVDVKPLDKENPSAKWVDKKEVSNTITHPNDREFFLKIYDEIK